MAQGTSRLRGVATSPVLRSAAALLLLTALATTGLATAADPAAAAPPPPAITSSPPGVDRNAAPTWTFATVTVGAVPECSLVPSTSPAVFGPCTSDTSYVGSLSANGTYTFAVREANPGVDDGATSGGDYVFDTVATAVVTPPPSPGNTLTPTWNVVPEAGATARCTFEATVTDPCSGAVTGTLGAGAADGPYALVVDVTDQAGNTASITSTYQFDRTAPGPPAVTGSSGLGRTQPSWSWSTAGTASSLCTLVGPAPQGPVGCDSGTYAPTLTQDGSYHVEVVVTDAAGNDSPTAGIGPTYDFDSQPPPAPVFTTTPPSPGKDTTPTWEFTATGVSTTCQLTGAVSGALPQTACSSPYTPTLTEDSWTLTVATSDAAGNTSSAASSYLLNTTTRPSPPVITTPANPSSNGSPAWTWTAEPGTTSECEGVTNGVPSGTWSPCTSGAPMVLPSEGSYQISVRVTDVNNLVSDPATSSAYVYDASAPAAPTVTSASSPSNALQTSFTFTSGAGESATCRLLYGGAEVRPSASCTSPFAVDLTGLPDGDYNLEVTLRDVAGNLGTPGTSVTPYRLDTTAPAAPLVTGPATASVVGLTFAWTAEAGSVADCRLVFQGVPSPTTTPCTSPFTPYLLNDGTWSLQVTSTDVAGNTSQPGVSASYLLDRIAPAVPTQVTAPPSPSRQPLVTWTFQIEVGTRTVCTVRSATDVVAPQQPCSSPWTTDLGSFGDGAYTLSVRAVDPAGNVSERAVVEYVLDRSGPVPPVISSAPGSPAPDRMPTWSIQPSDPADLLECRLQGLPGSGWSTCSVQVTFDLGAATSGTFTLQVRETDAAGNVSAVTTSGAYVLDLLAPPVPQVLPPSPQRSNQTRPVFQVSKDPLQTEALVLSCTATRFDGKPATTLPCDFGANVVDVTGLHGDGPVELAVRGVDTSGNRSAAGTARYSFDDIPPAAARVLAPESPVDFSATPTWTFAGPRDAVSFVCELRRGGDIGPLVRTRCASPYTVRLPSPGDYTLSVWSVDAAGNLAVTGARASYTQLSTVPVPGAPQGPTAGSDATPTWTLQVPAGYTATCLLGLPGGGGVEFRCVSRTSPTPSVAQYVADLWRRPSGTYTVRVQLVDSFGNEGAFGPAAGYRYVSLARAGSGPGAPGGAVAPPGPVGPTSPTAPPKQLQPGTPPSGAVGPTTPTHRALPRPAAGLIATEVPAAIARTVTQALSQPTIPLVLLSVVVGFLLLQNRIDRRDPKLRSAPVGAEPELEFGPALGPRRGWMLDGGAPA